MALDMALKCGGRLLRGGIRHGMRKHYDATIEFEKVGSSSATVQKN